MRKKHPDRMWAAETFGMMAEICQIYGPGASTYISQDDKSSVHIGVIAAKKQSAMLMNMRCRVRLPDHDFSVGSRHLLCPSVIAHCQPDPNTGKIGYTGKTYIGIRSSKHNNSTAYTHHEDLIKFIEQNQDIFHTETGEVKPILVKGVDGGPDENPRFDKNIVMGCKNFQVINADFVDNNFIYNHILYIIQDRMTPHHCMYCGKKFTRNVCLIHHLMYFHFIMCRVNCVF